MTAAVEVRRTNTILYCDTLGLAVTYANDWFVEVHVAETAHLSLADATRAIIPASGGAGITLSWQVPDLDDARAALRERGIAVTDPSVRWNSTYVEFFDPEGTRIELWSPAP